MRETQAEADAILKPFGKKASRFPFRTPKEDKRINILHGSVRSAKTWAMIPKIIRLLRWLAIMATVSETMAELFPGARKLFGQCEGCRARDLSPSKKRAMQSAIPVVGPAVDPVAI
jgi:hypothetical protein